MHTLQHYLQKAEQFLKEKEVSKPRLEAQLLFSHALKLSRVELFTSDRMPLSEEEVTNLRQLVVEKGAGKPTAYILQKKEFFSRDFFVNEHVLIPRPETEELVEWVLSREQLEGKNVADLGCGSGCIGVSLALEANLAALHLIDVSEQALQVANENFKTYKCECNCEFITSDLFDQLEKSAMFDLVISNPPYVTEDEFAALDPGVKNFEPRQALLVEEPTQFFQRLFQGAFEHLKPGGKFYLETNPNLIDQQKTVLEDAGFKNTYIKTDLSEKRRFLYGEK